MDSTTRTLDETKQCPFCGSEGGAIYKITGKDYHGFERPEIFCDNCKATVYFEDSTSTGADIRKDFEVLNIALVEGWNSRSDQAIATALELIIGNNEPYTDITTANDAINEAILQRNVLRGEQRARAALFVEKGDE